MHGLNTYDYGARQNNPVTARWDRMDPLCEKDYGTSPYVYCANAPVNKFDPDGRKIKGLSVDIKGNVVNTTYAITVQGNYNKKDNYGQYFKNGKIKEATITLYLGSIEWSTNDKGNKNYGLSVDEAIGVEAGHEAVHATDESEIDKDKKYENNHNGLPRSDKGKKADSVEDKIRQETFENKNKQ